MWLPVQVQNPIGMHAFVNDVNRPVILQNLKRIREQGCARHTRLEAAGIGIRGGALREVLSKQPEFALPI